MDTTQLEESGSVADDLLFGKQAVVTFLAELLSREKVDPYYLKKRGWPIGNAGGVKGRLIASKRRLTRHAQKLTAA